LLAQITNDFAFTGSKIKALLFVFAAVRLNYFICNVRFLLTNEMSVEEVQL